MTRLLDGRALGHTGARFADTPGDELVQQVGAGHAVSVCLFAETLPALIGYPHGAVFGFRRVRHGHSSVRFHLDEETVNTDEGVLTLRTVPAIIPAGDFRARTDIANDLGDIVKAHPGHQFNGWIERYGEEPDDIRRYGIRNGKVVEQHGRIVWPEDDADD